MASLVEVIFLGTGTSGGVPNVSCLTDPAQSCGVCLSAVTDQGRKNMRKNTSLIVRFRAPGESSSARIRNILIDCGKTFYESAIQLFPRYGIRELDAVILTHGHADACYGLDDLRQWTLNGAIQNRIDIYLAPETMDTVETTFPFLVDAKNATGGGDVATFKYHIFKEDAPFSINGLEFMPLPVHHGIYFTTSKPYFCYGFNFGGVSYISDTNFIPNDTKARMKGKTDILIIDCLRVGATHPSHFGLEDSLKTAREFKPAKTYLVGFAHRTDHYQLEEGLKSLEKDEQLRIMPAFDGLRVGLQDEKMITESSWIDPERTVILK
ncbi:metallo-beta-lactamase family protein [Radiomyces spectabilis]|uniref:metallo-beta-lactamase family protein n=1 Tax=Radiomyces spectabilis TaxID=64574 RepID=UPI0022204BF6|nr:metallo-beta-lactamase family protein [Radiomyces spectabilis]KAI8366045.1 metallo-beta-lactamase family protein [Radiomyces spectabilis]